MLGGLSNWVGGGKIEIGESDFDDIEDQLIMSDLGVAASAEIVSDLRDRAGRQRLKTGEDLRDALHDDLVRILEPVSRPLAIREEAKPFVILMVGVNGVGKTTTLAKIAAHLKSEGRRVMLGACDTFRAAAIEQLQVWGERLDIPVIAQAHGADAAAVAHDAFSAARARNYDVLMIDSAGRQQANQTLMAQLEKLQRVLKRADPTAPHEALLTVDAGNGQNVLSQVASFGAAVSLTGVCVTKLDGTAKGGVLIALAKQHELPIPFIGVGEAIDDLKQFDPVAFADALLPPLS